MKRLDPIADPESKGDLPNELDLWFADEIEYEDLSESGKQKVDQIMKKSSNKDGASNG